MSDFNRKVVKIGTITVSCAIVANFLPVLYFWIVYGEIPTLTQLTSIFSMIFAASFSRYPTMAAWGWWAHTSHGSPVPLQISVCRLSTWHSVSQIQKQTLRKETRLVQWLFRLLFSPRSVLLVCSPLSAVRSFQCSLSLSLHHLPICRRHFSPQYS